MNPASKDIKDMLIADSSFSFTFGGNDGDLFIAREPKEPKSVTTILDTPGKPPQLTYVKGENYFYEGVQVRIRNTNYSTGYALANQIMEFLHGRAGETWNGTYYSVIICTGGPWSLGWDDNNRVIFIINFEVQRR